MKLRVDRGHWPERLRRLEEAGWRVVPGEGYTREPGRQMVLHERVISCHLPARDGRSALFYNALAKDCGPNDFESSMQGWSAVASYFVDGFDVLADCRRLTLVEGRFSPLMQHVEPSVSSYASSPAALTRVRKSVTLLPNDVSRHFWSGLFGVMVRPTPVFTVSPDEAWALTDATADERLACERAAEIAFGTSEPSIAEQVARRLDLEPGLELAAVAKALGLSPRSLQRRLTGEEIRFAALRDEARLRRANALVEAGAKVEAIAREVGFASTSHFIQWYRVRTQRTPGGRGRRSTSPLDEA